MIGGIARLRDEKPLGIPGSAALEEKTAIERLVPSGSPYMISMRGMYQGKMCVVTLRLTPIKGEDYEAIYTWDDARCYVSLSKITTSGTGEVVRSKTPGLEQTAVCKDGFN
ncbi:MAG: hypothetical protein QM776_15560 [Rhodocyclaceae bacterium]